MKRKSSVLLTAAIVVFATMIVGCAEKPKAADSKEAIQQAKQLQTVEEQVKHLVQEANGFINSKQFDEAVNTAKYILSNLDKESLEAKTILEKAQAELKKMAEAKAEELKRSLTGSL